MKNWRLDIVILCCEYYLKFELKVTCYVNNYWKEFSRVVISKIYWIYISKFKIYNML